MSVKLLPILNCRGKLRKHKCQSNADASLQYLRSSDVSADHMLLCSHQVE